MSGTQTVYSLSSANTHSAWNVWVKSPGMKLDLFSVQCAELIFRGQQPLPAALLFSLPLTLSFELPLALALTFLIKLPFVLTLPVTLLVPDTKFVSF